MTAYNEYPTDFTTYEEFRHIYKSPPGAEATESLRFLSSVITAEQLALKTESEWTIAHELASKGTLPDKFKTTEWLLLADISRITVAHALAESGTLPEEYKTAAWLKRSDIFGGTIAHCLAKSGTLPKEFLTGKWLFIADDHVNLVGEFYVEFLLENNLCDRFPPKFLRIRHPRDPDMSVANILKKKIESMPAEMQMTTISKLPQKSLLYLLSTTTEENAELHTLIKKSIERDTESEVFENSTDQDHAAEDLYEMERG